VSRRIAFDRLHNVRDLGGWPGHAGRLVRSGVLYRADSLAKLEGEDLERFRALGVRTVIDLRYPWEIEARGRVPESVATDFALTELATARLVADWRAANADRVLGWPSYGRAPATIIQHFLGDLTAAHGSVEAYIKDGVGVGDDVVAVLRERPLER
jgi:hypothetical protein